MNNKDLITDNNLKLFGEDYVKQLILQIKQAGKDSSGKLIKSVDYRLQRDASDIQIFIESEDYLTYIDEGRKAGSWPPISEISKWARLKGIPQEAVFPIARNIFKYGIKPTNILDKTKQNILTNKVLENKIQEELVKNTEDYLYNTLTNKK